MLKVRSLSIGKQCVVAWAIPNYCCTLNSSGLIRYGYDRHQHRFMSTDRKEGVVIHKSIPTSTAGNDPTILGLKIGEKKQGVKTDACGIDDNDEDDEEDDMEEMFVQGPAGVEWGGPTRGGRRPEPTRFGDWERNGRASDF